MLLLLHVSIALASVVYTTYLFASPAKEKFYVAYTLIGLTLVSGTALVVTTHSPLLASCEAGLLYGGVVLTGMTMAHRRLVHERAKDSDRSS